MKRSFIPGEEWIYYKLYSGTKSADRVLTQHILPLAEELMEVGVVEEWFFIRYSDPDEHVRVRFRVKDITAYATVISQVTPVLKQLHDTGIIWKIMMDTYNREVERYGSESIPVLESLFFVDSKHILKLLGAVTNQEHMAYVGMYMIDTILSVFGNDLAAKNDLATMWHDSMGKEFNMDKNLRVQIDGKYRKSKKSVAGVFDNSLFDTRVQMILKSYKNQLTDIATKIDELYAEDKIEVEKKQLLNSICHMSMNRLFRSKQRMSEMVIYGYLSRYYNSMLMREKYSKKGKKELAEAE
jgi:thiopeptide-type bacteriocin biosynthesis protein